MTTAYNVRDKLMLGGRASRQVISDPGSAGTILVVHDRGVCTVTGGTLRTLEAAAQVPLGTEILVIPQTTTITVSGQALTDGQSAKFVVTLNSSGVNQWVKAFGPV